MAERRMLSKRIVESARFLKMPISSQALYFHLSLNADDDGVVEAFGVMRMINSSEDDLHVLEARQFIVILNEDLVCYIVDWRENNKLRADRKIDTIYRDLLMEKVPGVNLLAATQRSDRKKSKTNDVPGTSLGPAKDGQLSAEYSVVEDSRVEDRVGKCSKEDDYNTAFTVYENNIGTIGRTVAERIVAIIDDSGLEAFKKAVSKANTPSKRNINYIDKTANDIAVNGDYDDIGKGSLSELPGTLEEFVAMFGEKRDKDANN